eukprot:15416987-Alexandrium_andersonii.AAC.1
MAELKSWSTMRAAIKELLISDHGDSRLALSKQLPQAIVDSIKHANEQRLDSLKKLFEPGERTSRILAWLDGNDASMPAETHEHTQALLKACFKAAKARAAETSAQGVPIDDMCVIIADEMG